MDQSVHLSLLFAMVHYMLQRIYTPKTPTVENAFDKAVKLGLVDADASGAEKLGQVVAFAEEQMSSQLERVERARAYEAIAEDEERSAAIEASVLNAVRQGIL